jgi:hypothetical protein
VLEGGKVERKTPLYWHFNRASGDPKVAMRVGDWKILATLDKTRRHAATTSPMRTERDFKEAGAEEFHALQSRAPTSARRTISPRAEPAKLAELKALLEAKYAEVKNESPCGRPGSSPAAEGKKIEWPDYVKKKKAAPAKKQP